MRIIEREREEVQVDVEHERRANVLEAAALEIEYRGWCQGTYYANSGAVCMEAALVLGGGEQTPLEDIWSSFFGGYPYLSLSGWNDVHSRTAAEVCFVLRWRAAEIRDGR